MKANFEPCHLANAPGWEKVASTVHYEDHYLRIERAAFRTPTRPHQPVEWTVAYRKAAVVIAPLTVDGKYLLICQERLPVQRTLWEFPAGQIDEPNHRAEPGKILATAQRELLEEAGHTLDAEGRWIPLGYFFSSPGFSDEHTYQFLAQGVVPTPEGNDPDPGESILECRAFSPEEISTMIVTNEIVDANTLTLCARLQAMGHL